MSIGPSQQEEIYKATVSEKTRVVIKSTVKSFMVDSVLYLLCGSFAAMQIGLFFGMKFPIQFYATTSILAGVRLFQFFIKRKEVTITQDGLKD